MSAATALVPAICWREPLRTISAAPLTISSVARAATRLQRGEVQGYDFNRMVFEFTMLIRAR